MSKHTIEILIVLIGSLIAAYFLGVFDDEISITNDNSNNIERVQNACKHNSARDEERLAGSCRMA